MWVQIQRLFLVLKIVFKCRNSNHCEAEGTQGQSRGLDSVQGEKCWVVSRALNGSEILHVESAFQGISHLLGHGFPTRCSEKPIMCARRSVRRLEDSYTTWKLLAAELKQGRKIVSSFLRKIFVGKFFQPLLTMIIAFDISGARLNS